MSACGRGARDRLGAVRPTLLLLLGAVVAVWLIGTVNLTNLQQVRAAARRRELALRAALGAGRGRVARQLLTESSLLGLFGGAAGLAVAYAGVPTLVTLLPADVPRAEGIRVNGLVLSFAAVVSLGTALAAGTLPALRAARLGEHATLAGLRGNRRRRVGPPSRHLRHGGDRGGRHARDQCRSAGQESGRAGRCRRRVHRGSSCRGRSCAVARASSQRRRPARLLREPGAASSRASLRWRRRAVDRLPAVRRCPWRQRVQDRGTAESGHGRRRVALGGSANGRKRRLPAHPRGSDHRGPSLHRV